MYTFTVSVMASSEGVKCIPSQSVLWPEVRVYSHAEQRLSLMHYGALPYSCLRKEYNLPLGFWGVYGAFEILLHLVMWQSSVTYKKHNKIIVITVNNNSH